MTFNTDWQSGYEGGIEVGLKAGAREKQERIIKLLQSIEGPYYEEDGAWSLKDGINLAIELIEGETK